MKKANLLTYAASLFLLSLTSCIGLKCDEATVCVRNNATHPDSLIIYSWDSWDEPSDTLYPGECATKVVENLEYHRGLYGSSTTSDRYQTFYTIEGEFEIDITDCDMEVNAPFGYIDYDALSEHCRNGEFDPALGERMLDCGGEFCDDCDEVTFSCALETNVMKFQDDVFDKDWSYCYVNESSFDIEFEFSFGMYEALRVTYNDTKMPEKDRVIYVGNDDYEASITYQTLSSQWYAKSGQEVYIIFDENNVPYLQFCDLEFVGDWERTANGKLEILD